MDNDTPVRDVKDRSRFGGIVRRMLRFSGKAFVWGVGVAFAGAAIGAAVYWYNNRSVQPKQYPFFPMPSVGIKYRLTTKWEDGSAYYKFTVAPIDESLATEFDTVARSDSPKSFVIHLGDSTQFSIPNCELDITALTPTVGDKGLVESLDAQGSSSACSRSDYLRAVSFYPTYSFPDVKKGTSSRIDFKPLEKYEVEPPKPEKEISVGIEATVTCDVIVFDRDKFDAGDPKAIDSLHTGDTVGYIGHATVSDEDIIRVHGRKGYVDNCISVKQ